MRTEEELREILRRLDTPDRQAWNHTRDPALDRELKHILYWVLGETDQSPLSGPRRN